MLGPVPAADPPPGLTSTEDAGSHLPVGLQHRRPIDRNGQSSPQCGRRRPWPAAASRLSSFMGVACSLGTGTSISYQSVLVKLPSAEGLL
jgi:hypothetical protein